jgi:hypothetical protein
MHACDLRDRVLPGEEYLRFKDVLGEFKESFLGRAEPLGKGLLSVTECRVQLNPPSGLMTDSEQEKQWQWLLEVCRLHGFEPTAS